MNPKLTRLRELLADLMTGALSLADHNELERLERELGPEERAAFEHTAAALDLSLGPTEFEPLPAELAARLKASAAALASPRPAPRVRFSLGRSREVLAWGLLAACILIALASTFGESRPRYLSVAEQRAVLLREAPDALTLPWTATKDPAARDASGDLVWSNRDQRGYMRFRGLEGNDPKKSQYQLWIFDADQDERYPIDGGLFDMPSTTGDVIVPITPKLHVGRPTLFAITVEKPGGVVVSKRERLPLVAKVAAAAP